MREIDQAPMEMNAKKWLNSISTLKPDCGWFGPISLSGLQVSFANHGRVMCSLRIPTFATDNEGWWQPGSIATVIDIVGAAAILSAESTIKVSVDFVVSYFSRVKLNEEVDIDAQVTECKGKSTMVVVEIRKKGSRELVAKGRQWMAFSSARPFESKL